MRRSLTLITALSVLALAAPAHGAGGPYKLDAKGKCRDAKGAFVKAEMCKSPVAAGKCRDAKTKKFVKCGTAGSQPVPMGKK